MFEKRLFFWAGIYGIAVLLPMLFLEDFIANQFPPASNHPEQYYGFISVALAWQFAFLIIARDPIRYRPFMTPAIIEKLLSSGAIILLFMQGRIDVAALSPFLVDLMLGMMFILAYVKTGKTLNEM